MRSLSKFSMGVGDRFGMAGVPQLRAFMAARERGVTITPVWNKSNREHSLIGTRPEDVRAEADMAVERCGWEGDHFVDADHIGLGTVDRFLASSDFFTIDVADAIGKAAPGEAIAAYTADMQRFVGSGSDEFSLYPIMRRAIMRTGAGLHLKTAGTTWLEEVVGLAAADGEGLAFAKALYRDAYGRYDELAEPYLTVIAIERQLLPTPDAVDVWTARQYVEALEHNQTCPRFNSHFRQMVHISFRLAAEKLPQYLELLDANRASIETHVLDNLCKRHMEPLFLGTAS